MARLVLVFSLRLIALVAFATAATAGGRVALVIGNSAYQAVNPLPNPVNDAHDMAEAFKKLGFDVTLADNLTYEQMRQTLQHFGDKAHGADMAVIYYAGHGMEIDHRNYLIPVDARLQTDRAVAFETIPLDLMMATVDGARSLKIVLLDACRSNPFAARMKLTVASRSIGRGLSQVEPDTGTLVGFSAKEGTVAGDGTGRNSPYTVALLSHIAIPGLEISLMFRQVRDAVLEATDNQQEPFTYGSLPGKSLYFVPPVSAETLKATRNQSDTAPTPGPDLEAWNAIKDSTSIAVFETYIKQFPDSLFVAFAKARLAELKAQEQATLPQTERTDTPAKETSTGTDLQPPAPPLKPSPAPGFNLKPVCRGWLAKFRRGHKPHAAFAAGIDGSCGWSAGGYANLATAIAEALRYCHQQNPTCKIIATK